MLAWLSENLATIIICVVLAEVGQDGLENMISKSEMND